MQIFRRVNIKSDVRRHSVATIGFFDGVHRGHRFLINEVKLQAENRDMDSLVITFPQSPSDILNPRSSQPLLTTSSEKVRLLHESGIDIVAMLPFTKELSMQSAYEFMTSVMKTELHVCAIVMGYDHRFGKKTDDDNIDYAELGREVGIDVLRYRPLSLCSDEDERVVSSSAIREALLCGDIEKANRCLGYHYTLEGTVVDGHHVGTGIGYPTANLMVDEHKLVPSNGVYSVNVTTDDGVQRKGMLNIGRRPTLDNGSDRTIEVNIFDFNSDLYGASLRIEFNRYIRPEMKFDTLDDLRRQLESDRALISDN